MTRAWRLLVASFGAIVLLVGLAIPAFAHATLNSSTPSNGARVETSPKQVVLSFSERVEVSLGGIRVFDSTGKRVDHGTISHPNGVGSQVAIALPKLKDGGYVVTWRVISADSHPVQGAFTFTVGNAAPAKATEVAGLLGASGGSRVVGVTYGVGRFVAFAAMLVLLGVLAFVATVWAAGAQQRRVRRLALWSLVVLAVATVVNLVLQGGYGAGLSLGGSLSGAVVGDVLKTRLGHLYELRLVLLVLAAALLAVWLRRQARPSWWNAAALVVGVGIAATPGLAGHAYIGADEPWALLADVAHVCAAAVWIGGLVVLLAAVLPRVDFDESTAIVRGFSRNAMYAVAVIVATGVFQAYRQIGTLDALKSTDYGKLVVIKTLLVAAVLCIAVASRNFVHKRWSPASARMLRRTVGLEALIAVGVLAVTSVLVNAVPAKTLVAKPQSGELTGKAMLLDYTASPGRVGPNEIHLYALTKTGVPENVVEMKLTLSQPGRGIAPIDVPLQNAGPGHFQSLNFTVPFSGQWKIEVTARTSDIDEEVLDGTVTFR
ncbi:MAG TPA: copper resistance protein CopC [Acidimicrobiales bacterium]|nr:copper resistance protein CopC [Acidimicrobiales bacterium]